MNVDTTRHIHTGQAAHPAAAVGTPALTPSGPARHARKRRVLVIHGDEEIRRLIAVSLTLEGFDVTTASSRQDCRYKVRSAAPEILITTSVNIHHPGDSGTDGQFQRCLANSRVKVLLINAASEPGGNPPTGTGVDTCVTTPFDVAEMVTQVRQLIEQVPKVPPYTGKHRRSST